jgi:hypothetical protein
VFVTPPDSKKDLKMGLEVRLAQIKEERARRDEEEANMDISSLRHTLSIWRQIDSEQQGDETARKHCQLKIQEYEQKLLAHEKVLGRGPGPDPQAFCL